jgi:8-oxo-dGTP diphosphatase
VSKVAKVLIRNAADKYLLLWRSDHPTFPNDPDLPGGTLDAGEQPIQTAVREVEEEAGIVIKAENLHSLYEGTDFSGHGTTYYLYACTETTQQEPAISWEHADYEWVTKDELLVHAKAAKDTYMQMVYSVLH